jgi:hypothetical protein
MNTTLNKTESSSVMASHFLRDLQSHPPRRLGNERAMARENLDAILPSTGRIKETPQIATVKASAKASKSTAASHRPQADRTLWIVVAILGSLSLSVVGLVAWALRSASASTFWGGVGFTAILFGGAVIVGLWGAQHQIARDPRVDALRRKNIDDDEDRHPLFPVIGFDFLRYDELNLDD